MVYWGLHTIDGRAVSRAFPAALIPTVIVEYGNKSIVAYDLSDESRTRKQRRRISGFGHGDECDGYFLVSRSDPSGFLQSVEATLHHIMLPVLP